jgi:glycosyltransferase involved in cell wall biosynthesis
MQRRIISITTNLSRYGGAQKVLMDVHNGLKIKYDCIVTGRQKFEDLHPKYAINRNEYVEFSPSLLKNNIVLVHARNIIPFIVVLNKLLFLDAKIIYVSHNVYNTHKIVTIFPKNIVSISHKVTQNLVDYFKVKNKNITLIYNGIEDTFDQKRQARGYKENGVIKILYPARVNSVKRQLQVVENLKGKIAPNIKLYFAGVGEDFDKLKQICKDSDNFIPLGFVNNMEKLIVGYDYLMLYSIQEGLPIALLEGVMSKRPLLVNDVGGNLEIGVPGYNGIELKDSWEYLSKQINGLNNITEAYYNEMSENSRSLYLEKFQYDIMIDKYSDLIETLIK